MEDFVKTQIEAHVELIVRAVGYNTYEALSALDRIYENSTLYSDPQAKEYAKKLYFKYKDTEIVQYFLVNTDLGMSAGKVGAQVAHAATGIARGVVDRMIKDRLYNKPASEVSENWLEWNNGAVVVLGATEREIQMLMCSKNFRPSEAYLVRDEGRTENTVNAMTVLGFVPMARGEAQAIIGKFPVLGYEK